MYDMLRFSRLISNYICFFIHSSSTNFFKTDDDGMTRLFKSPKSGFEDGLSREIGQIMNKKSLDLDLNYACAAFVNALQKKNNKLMVTLKLGINS